jgi:integrase
MEEEAKEDTMSVFRRGKFYWFQFMFNGERVARTTKQCSKEAAKDIESAYRTALAKGEVGIREKRVERKRVSELLDGRIADLARRGKSTDVAEKVKEELGKHWADELTGEDLDAYFERQRAASYAVATIVNRITELTCAYTHAKMEPPMMRPLTEEEKDNVRTGFFTKSEFEAIRDHLPENLRPFVSWAYLTGMRHGSIAKLRWEHIDDEDTEMILPGKFTKNKESLKLPLTGERREVIRQCRAARAVKGEMPSALVFHRDGKPVKQFRLEWIAACLAAGQGKMVCPKCGRAAKEPTPRCSCSHCRAPMKYEGPILHDFRRTAARDMIRAGVPQRIAMLITGHKTQSIFDRYNIGDTSDLFEALAKTDDYRDEQQKKVRAIARKR